MTEEDIIKECEVSDVMTPGVILINEALPFTNVLELFSEHDFFIYPVVDKDEHLKGLISFEDVKNLISYQDCWDWVVAGDASQESIQTLKPEMPLEDAMELMHDLKVEQLPVIADDMLLKPIGVLDRRTIQKFLHDTVIERQRSV